MARTPLQPDEVHFANVPKRRITGGVIFVDPSKSKVLMVKPWYKDYWTLPGGIADYGESPMSAAKREAHEEIGLSPEHLEFIGIGSITTQNQRDVIHTFFFGGTLSEQQVQALSWDHDELDDCKFVSFEKVEELAGFTKKQAFSQHLIRLVEAALKGGTYYFEEQA